MEQWLESIGLAQYSAVFADNDIAQDDLGDLTEDDLKELGLSLGHRKRLLRAVVESQSAVEAATAVDRPGAADDATNWSRHAGERKPVTLLFADITGSTLLTEALDAEDAHDRLYSAVEQMCEAIEAERGTVCRFMGDGVMAMFGAPLSFEDHAARACAAALSLQQRMREYADALVQEGVLSSLLRRDRQRLHRLAADWFIGRDAGLHARHLDFAEDEGAPFAYLEAARSDVASHRFVFALDLLVRGLQLVKERAVEFQLRTLEGEVLSALGRTGESANAYRSAATLADDANDKCRALLGAAEALRTTGGYEDGLALLDEAQALTAADRTLELAQIHYMRWNMCATRKSTCSASRCITRSKSRRR